LTLLYITARTHESLQLPENNYYCGGYQNYGCGDNEPALSPLPPAFSIAGFRAGTIVHA